ncbi:uncharacterized protein [Montipora foliosa]|uniref:uncharacterized protein isoform X3 n=1 Tax=Montipora foliosa TaxID=591990 RepID=UPI0035F1EC71
MADESEDEACKQGEASSENEEEEIEPKEEKDEEYDVKPGDNDPSANGGGEGKGSFAKTLAITGLAGVGAAAVGVIAAPVIATAALGAFGFGASGVAAGSAAAAVQSSFFGGYVASGSLFALCQSAGATGVISTATTGLIGGTTGLAANDHPIYFRALKDYVKPGTVIVGLPGNPRFMAQGREVLCATGRKCTFIRFESLPWEYQITEFGTKCKVLSTRESLLGKMEAGDVSPRMEPVPTLQYLLGPRPKLTIARNRHL